MPTIDFNVNPFFDDFEADKKFYKILYRPGFAVQARELNQQQTILQNQIERFGRFVFEEGSIVTGVEHNLDLDVDYIKLKETFGGVNVNPTSFIGAKIVGDTSGAIAQVIHADEKTDSGDPPTLYVKNISGVFQNSEQITTQNGTSPISANLIDTNSVGKSSIFTVSEGIVFVNGIFSFVNSQLIVLEKYNNTPSFRVGLLNSEEIITPEDDNSLLDNATGSPNFSAPGAHRYRISILLDKKRLDFANEIDNFAASKFTELLRVENGIKKKEVLYPTLSKIEETLARRTFDESGNYTVEPFQLNVKNDSSDTTKIKVGLEPGKAFVRGFEHKTISTNFLEVDKGRDTKEIENIDINAQYGNYVTGTDIQGTTTEDILNTSTYETVTLLSSTIAGTTNATDFSNNTIGTARIRYIEYDSGATSNPVFRIYLFDIQMNTGESFSDVSSLWADTYSNGGAINITSGIFENQFNNLLFRAPHTATKTLKPGGVSDTSYRTQRSFDLTLTSGTGAINLSGNDSFFGATGELSDTVVLENYYVIAETVTGAGSTGISGGDYIDFTASGRSITLSGANQTATFDIGDASFEGAVKVIATVNVDQKSEKVKSLTTTTVSGVTLSNGIGDLAKSDVLKVTEVIDTGDSNADVTNKFDLDNGQTDNLYDHGSIILKPGESVVGPLNVSIEYFTHTGSGYFSVDSYTDIDFEDIPEYTIESTGETVNLRDVLDFRPRRTDDASTIDVPSVGKELPEPNSNISADYVFYLGRIDKVILRTDRSFDTIKGIPGVSPELPPDSDDSMTLYILRIPAYTFNPDDVEITYIDNRRFTMSDIGDIEKRVNTVEYYTALSLIEKETRDLTILNSSGLESFKTGIIVDTFVGHNVGDVLNSDYKCSIDFENQELRPAFNQDRIQFTLDVADSGNVVENSDLITLDFTEEVFTSQPVQNNSVSVNPFGLTNWIGTISLDPEVDSWFDTSRKPKVVVNTEGENNNWLVDNLNFQSQWNHWIVNWTGRKNNDKPDNFSRLSREIDDEDSRKLRNKIKSKNTPKSVLRSVNGFVVNDSIVPFLAEQDIDFVVRGLKPNTTVYPFFDDIDISSNVTPTGGSSGDTLVTDSNGTITGTFSIPADNSFKAGQRTFRVLDDSSGNILNAKTFAERIFMVRGVFETREDGIISTRHPINVKRSIKDSTALKDSITRELSVSNNDSSSTQWIDPMAQNFVVDAGANPDGIFLSSIDLFFEEKDDELPVTIEIRPTLNGRPHNSSVVPFSQKTLLPNEVKKSSNGSTATNIEFDAPLFLFPGEYSIVIKSNSQNYKLFTANIGSNARGTNKRITKQPFIQNFFRPQNAGSYTPDSNTNLKVRLNKAKFDISGVQSVVLNNVQPSEDTFAHVFYLITSQINPINTSARFFYKIKDDTSGNLDSSWQEFLPNINNTFSSKKIIESANSDTLQLKVDFSSNKEDVSPVIDLQRLNFIAIENLVNNTVNGEDSASGGDALSKYITKKVTLNDGFESDGLRVFTNVYNPNVNSIRVFYKVKSSGDSDSFDTKPWVEFSTSKNTGLISRNRDDFIEMVFEEDSITYDGFTDFKTFAIKVVINSVDETDVPRLQDLRVVALKS